MKDSHSPLKDFIILDTQWLIDIFKTIVTVRPEEKQVSLKVESNLSRWSNVGLKADRQEGVPISFLFVYGPDSTKVITLHGVVDNSPAQILPLPSKRSF